MLIGFFCGVVIFCECPQHQASYECLLTLVFDADIVVFGKLICPAYDFVWNSQELSYHSGTNDYWVAVRGTVYDLTNFYKLQYVN